MPILSRKPPEQRKERILKAAYSIALKKGINNLTRKDICQEAKISLSLLTHYFFLSDIKNDVLRKAEKNNELNKIIK